MEAHRNQLNMYAKEKEFCKVAKLSSYVSLDPNWSSQNSHNIYYIQAAIWVSRHNTVQVSLCDDHNITCFSHYHLPSN